jgi:shikimate dehydrogenase
MITGRTKKIGILGWPVDHSLSPLMQNAAFESLHIDYVYIPLPVESKYLAQAIAGLKVLGFTGANVTIPHKVAIMSYLDEIDSSAQIIGAVNTVVIKEGKCIGYNTDAQGFIQSLITENVIIAGKSAVIMGAGGASRAVACGLIQHGINHITVGARNLEKVQKFVKGFPVFPNIEGCDWNENIFKNCIRNCDILINCTPLGMSADDKEELPIIWDDVSTNTIVCDLIYNPSITPFLTSAQNHGNKIINGA